MKWISKKKKKSKQIDQSLDQPNNGEPQGDTMFSFHRNKTCNTYVGRVYTGPCLQVLLSDQQPAHKCNNNQIESVAQIDRLKFLNK